MLLRNAGGDSPAFPCSDLAGWGWDAGWAAAFAAGGGGLAPARVIAQHRGRWLLASETGELAATLTGRLRHEAGDGELPAVGDWVGFVPPAHDGDAHVDCVLPRRTAFVRRAPGSRLASQVIATNIDVLLIATSLNEDLKPRRLERYVTMGRESGAELAVVLTKSDLGRESADAIDEFAGVLGIPVIALSSRSGEGLDRLGPWLQPGRTLAMVGSSGVGKSTLLNRLAGRELMTTREIREDDGRGRHATTHRELFRLPSGALLLDTPGMRELGLWDADEGIDEAFAEIVELAAGCRFADCSHRFEPGCAVRTAVAAGRLDAARLKSYRRLAHELAEQPSPVQRRVKDRRFGKAVRNASAESMARKIYPDRD